MVHTKKQRTKGFIVLLMCMVSLHLQAQKVEMKIKYML